MYEYVPSRGCTRSEHTVRTIGTEWCITITVGKPCADLLLILLSVVMSGAGRCSDSGNDTLTKSRHIFTSECRYFVFGQIFRN